jgi:quercetin dioxygenase-like cupin family protein
MALSRQLISVVKLASLVPVCFAAAAMQKSVIQPQAKVIKADMQGKDYVRLLGGPPETCLMRAGAVALRPGMTVGKHSTGAHEESIIVLEGEGTLLLNEDRELPLEVGTLAYCPPDTEHDVKNTGTTELRYIYVVAKTQ